MARRHLLILGCLVGLVACSDAATPTDPTDTTTATSDTVASVLVPPSLTIAVGDTFQVRAVVVLKAGGAELVTTNGTWQSADGAIVSVDSAGVITGVSSGSTGVAVSVDGIAGVTVVDVVESVGSRTFTGVAALTAGKVATLTLVFKTLPRVTGTLYTSAGSFLLAGRLDEQSRVVNVSGGGFTLLGTATGGTLAGTLTDPAGAAGAFSALESTHVAVTPFCGEYSTEGISAGGADEQTGALGLVAALDGTVAAATVSADASAAPATFIGRRAGDAFSLTSAERLPLEGTFAGSAVSGPFTTPAGLAAAFTARTRTCP
ncbi:MAG: hypothetical protein IT184_12255 [Acidobacteria bacterium]|nr:hypothetical protein [Acidobacteriota bacterium]